MDNRKFLAAAAIVAASFILSSPVIASGPDELQPSQSQAATAPENPPVVTTNVFLIEPPKPEIVGKKIFVNVVDSAKGSALVRARLDAHGFKTVETAEDADLTLRISGNFMISGAGKERFDGKLADLTNGLPADAGQSPDYYQEPNSLASIAITTLVFGDLSMAVSDLVTWLGKKTGIIGRVNNAMIGDPRGWCVGDACKRDNILVVAINTDDYGHWWLESQATDTRMVIDYCLADAIEKGLQPLLDLTAKPAVATSQDDQQKTIVQ